MYQQNMYHIILKFGFLVFCFTSRRVTYRVSILTLGLEEVTHIDFSAECKISPGEVSDGVLLEVAGHIWYSLQLLATWCEVDDFPYKTATPNTP